MAGRPSLLPNDRMWCSVADKQAVFDRATEPEEVLLILPDSARVAQSVDGKGDVTDILSKRSS